MCKETQAKLYAEGIATFALTFIGAGSIWVVGGDLLAVAAAHGIILSVMVTATMNISGAHINPAVTIGFMATNRIDSKLGAKYIAAQLAGAFIAGGILYSIGAGGVGTPAPGDTIIEVSTQQAILIEAVLTFLLMTVIMGTAVDDRAPAGIAGFGIGLVVMADILMGGPLTGAAMNPARWAGDWVWGDMGMDTANNIDLIIYTVGPIMGALLGVLLWDKMIPGENTE